MFAFFRLPLFLSKKRKTLRGFLPWRDNKFLSGIVQLPRTIVLRYIADDSAGDKIGGLLEGACGDERDETVLIVSRGFEVLISSLSSKLKS